MPLRVTVKELELQASVSQSSSPEQLKSFSLSIYDKNCDFGGTWLGMRAGKSENSPLAECSFQHI